MGKTRLITLIAFVFGLPGCGILGGSDDGVERTFPEAFSFETVTIQQILYEVEPPDSLNINAYVINIRECPEGAACFSPDGIDVSENFPSADTLIFIPATEPSQFQKEEQYQFSLKVSEKESVDRNILRLLGYSLIE